MLSIYILDYDKDIAFMLCEWFNQNGIAATGFSNPAELFNQLKVNLPDCIILDCYYREQLVTPETCKTIRKVLHYQGKILLTSTSSVPDMYLCECDTTTYITKPFNLPEVLDTVNQLLNDSTSKST